MRHPFTGETVTRHPYANAVHPVHGQNYWHCPDCDTEVFLHPEAEDYWWCLEALGEHEAVHLDHQKNLYGGNRNVLRLALKHPAVHAAITQVYGPVGELTDAHQRRIYTMVGIDHDLGDETDG